MALHKYFKPLANPLLPTKVSQLTEKELDVVNAKVEAITQEEKSRKSRTKYNCYTPEQRACIGRYAAENGPVRAMQYFSNRLCTELPETTARRFKKEYLKEISKKVATSKLPGKSSEIPSINSLPTKDQGRPLLLGKEIDKIVQEYIANLRIAGAPVTTAIVMGAAKGIICAKNSSLLIENGGHIEITNT